MANTTLDVKYYIYKMTCRTSGMSYIGMTKHKHKRFREHGNHSTARKLREAIELHGIDDFVFEVICECGGRREAHDLERAHISELGTAWPSGYNVMGGGAGSLSRIATPQSKALRAAAQRRLWDDPKHREIVSERVTAFWAKPENAAGLKERALSRWQNPVYRAKQEAAHWSRKKADETKEKIRQLALAREIEKREAGVTFDPSHLVEGTKRSWADPIGREKRLSALARFWESEQGDRLKEKARAQISEENARRRSDPEYAAKISAKIGFGSCGRTVSPATRQKMSDAKRGKKKGPLPEEVKAKIGAKARARASAKKLGKAV